MSDRPGARRRAVVVGAALAASLALAAIASAHGGDKVGEAVAGAYRVELYALGIVQEGRQGIDYTAYLRSRATGFPVDDATVRIAVRRTDGSTVGPRAASAFANGYDTVIPARDLAEREGQRVTVSIAGPLGRATARIVVRSSLLPGAAPGAADDGSSPVLWIAIGAAVAALLTAMVVVSVRGDRARRPPRPGA